MAGFIEKYGLVKYNRNLGKKYPRTGACEVCGQAEYVSYSGKTVKLVFDHCHIHGWVRGMICAGCNVEMGRVDSHIVRDDKDLKAAHDFTIALLSQHHRCPGCPVWEPWITFREYQDGLVYDLIVGIGKPGFQALTSQQKASYLENMLYRYWIPQLDPEARPAVAIPDKKVWQAIVKYAREIAAS